MTHETWSKFKDAMDAAGIKHYQVTVDTSTNLYNSDSAVLTYDDGTQSFLNVRGKVGTASDGYKEDIICFSAGVEDIHYAKFGASKKQILDFLDAYGANLTEDQKKVVLKINGTNYNIKPETGDYILAGFRVLSEEEIAELSAQEKIDYEKKLEIYNARKKTSNVVVSIDA